MDEKRIYRPLPEMVVNANIDPNDYENAVKKGKTDLEGFWGGYGIGLVQEVGQDA